MRNAQRRKVDNQHAGRVLSFGGRFDLRTAEPEEDVLRITTADREAHSTSYCSAK